MRRAKQTYITAHLKAEEIDILKELAKVEDKRLTDIVNEAVRAYLEPYKEARAEALKAYKEAYTNSIT